MLIKIKLLGKLQEGRFDSQEWDLPEETCVCQVLQILKIQPGETMILVNGKFKSRDQVLNEGDSLALLTPMGGG